MHGYASGGVPRNLGVGRKSILQHVGKMLQLVSGRQHGATEHTPEEFNTLRSPEAQAANPQTYINASDGSPPENPTRPLDTGGTCIRTLRGRPLCRQANNLRTASPRTFKGRCQGRKDGTLFREAG